MKVKLNASRSRVATQFSFFAPQISPCMLPSRSILKRQVLNFYLKGIVFPLFYIALVGVALFGLLDVLNRILNTKIVL